MLRFTLLAVSILWSSLAFGQMASCVGYGGVNSLDVVRWSATANPDGGAAVSVTVALDFYPIKAIDGAVLLFDSRNHELAEIPLPKRLRLAPGQTYTQQATLKNGSQLLSLEHAAVQIMVCAKSWTGIDGRNFSMEAPRCAGPVAPWCQ